MGVISQKSKRKGAKCIFQNLEKRRKIFYIFSQSNFLQIVFGSILTDRISNSRLYKKWGSSRDVMRERLRWQVHVLWTKDDILPKIVPPRAKGKASRPSLAWEDVVRQDLREMETSWERVNREMLNRLEWRMAMHSSVGFQADCCCSELLIVEVIVGG